MLQIKLNVVWLVSAALVSLRVGAAMAFLPFFNAANVPSLVRVAWVAALSATLVAGLPWAGLHPPLEVLPLLAAALSEVVIGLSLAFGVLVAYGAALFAGKVLDVQMGFGIAGLLNPATRSNSPLMGTLLGMAMLVLFLSMDGHLALIRALSASLAGYPPGSLVTDPGRVGALVQQSSALFTFAFLLIAPVVTALLLADLVMAVMARSLPQLNVFVLSFPVKILLGLAGTALSLGLSRVTLTQLFDHTYQQWDQLVAVP